MTLAISLEQAVATALQGWIASQLPDTRVYDRWPEAVVELAPKTITVLGQGSPKTDYLDEFQISSTLVSGNQYLYTWRVAQRELPIQIDLWATNHPQLDDMLARLLPALRASKAQSLAAFLAANPVPYLQPPIENDLTLQLAGAWSQVLCAYTFDDPAISYPYKGEEADAVKRREYRAIYHGMAYYDVIITAQSSQLNTLVLREYVAKLLANPPTGAPIHLDTITAVRVVQSDSTQ